MKRFLPLLLAASCLAGSPAAAQNVSRHPVRFRGQRADDCPTTSISAKSAAWRRIRRATSSSIRAPAIRRSRWRRARLRARRLAAVPVRSQRQATPARSARTSTASCSRAGPRRSARQHLGRRSDDQHGHQVRSAGARGLAARAQGGRHAHSDSAARRRCLRAWRDGRRAPDSRATCSTVRPTSPGTPRAISSSPTAGQCARRQVRQGRRVREVLGFAGHRRRPVRHRPQHRGRRAGAMSMSPTAATTASRCSTTTARSRRQFTAVGNPQAICLTPGANPVLYVSNSNPPNDIDTAGEIYKMDLDGTLLGKFGRAGRC